jgi:hypothetical protein
MMVRGGFGPGQMAGISSRPLSVNTAQDTKSSRVYVTNFIFFLKRKNHRMNVNKSKRNFHHEKFLICFTRYIEQV